MHSSRRVNAAVTRRRHATSPAVCPSCLCGSAAFSSASPARPHRLVSRGARGGCRSLSSSSSSSSKAGLPPAHPAVATPIRKCPVVGSAELHATKPPRPPLQTTCQYKQPTGSTICVRAPLALCAFFWSGLASRSGRLPPRLLPGLLSQLGRHRWVQVLPGRWPATYLHAPQSAHTMMVRARDSLGRGHVCARRESCGGGVATCADGFRRLRGCIARRSFLDGACFFDSTCTCALFDVI